MSDSLSKDSILSALKAVIDPEVGVNVVDLGLIYDIKISESDTAHVLVSYTMTSPACPLGEFLESEMRESIGSSHDPRPMVDLKVVWEPIWDESRMSDEAKRILNV